MRTIPFVRALKMANALPCLSILAFGLFISNAIGAEPVLVSRATDVVRQWQSGQHLYVKGNLGVSAAALSDLESWLDQNATNWTVVLVEAAADERYTDAEGESFDGVEAVNHALGKGLMNQTVFGQQLDSRTGERNAAFFILFLKERRLSYFGSDAQDKRGLGEEDWIGKLDAPAIAAMRSGARVIDAVKDTITNIDKRLAARITQEAQEQQRRIAAAENAKREAIQRAQAALETAQSTFLLAESKAGEFSRTFASVTGDLGRPDLPRLKADLQAVQSAVAQGDPAKAQNLAEALRDHVQRLIRAWEQYPADGQKLQDLADRLNREKARAYARTATPQLQAAAETVATAQREYVRGDSSYVPLLDAATQAVTAAGHAISRAEEQAAQRRILWSMGAFSALAAAAVLGLLLNRRRAPLKAQAHQLHSAWQEALSAKTDALFGLLDRRSRVVGASAEDAAQHYSGESLRLSEQLIQDVDQLFIMSSCAGRVLERAQGLLEPRIAWLQLANFFLAGRYRRAVALLRDEPIAFRPEEGLELVVRGTRTERDRLIGGLSSYQPFTMSFNELVGAFNQRAERALAALELLESSLQNAPGALHALQESLDKTRSREMELKAATERDGYFDLRRVYTDLLPAAQSGLLAARQTAISDPVGALQSEGARVRQQADDAASLVVLAQEAHSTVIPQIGDYAEALTASGVDTSWVGAGLAQLSTETDEVACLALKGRSEKEIKALAAKLVAFNDRCREASVLDKVRREQAQTQIAESTENIKSARAQIAQGLGKVPGEALREEGNDPTDFVAQAQAQFESAFAALSRGDVEAARGALTAVAELTAQANEIVTASLKAFASHRESHSQLRAEADRVASLLPERAQLLGEITAQYAPSVLQLGAGDPSHPNANGTLADNIHEAKTQLREARNSLDNAESCYKEARMLRSAALLEDSRQDLETACYRLAEIVEKRSRLTETEAANRDALAQLDTRRAECQQMSDEPSTMTGTIDAFVQAARQLDDAHAAATAPAPDPFAVSTMLAQVKMAFASVTDRARADRQVHEQAGLSLTAAARQLATAEQEAANTQHDDLPDSAAIHQARLGVSDLARALAAAQQAHGRAHGDWHALDQEATRISSAAASATATLRRELQQAQACVAAITVASQRVRAARGWSGAFGVLIGGSPGSDLLAQAQGLLQQGEYVIALQYAENARNAAERAIAQAQAEERRRRAEEEARLARERRRREEEEAARRRRNSFNTSSFGHGSGGFGGRSSSFGSGSGTRSSSFRSGSGVRTSGW